MIFDPPGYRPKSSEPARLAGQPAHGGTAVTRERRRKVRTIKPQTTTTTAPSPMINVTPLIDVVLVLLIVFMAVTPAPVHDLDVQLVGSSQSDSPAAVPSEQLVLTIEDADSIRVNEETLRRHELTERLRSILASRRPEGRTVFVVAGDRVAYATLVETIEAAKRAGTSAIGFATDATP